MGIIDDVLQALKMAEPSSQVHTYLDPAKSEDFCCDLFFIERRRGFVLMSHCNGFVFLSVNLSKEFYPFTSGS